MRKHLLILCSLAPLLLLSCSMQESIELDTPGFVTYTITGDRIQLQIHSTQPTATITHTIGEWSADMVIQSHYYSCISLAIDPATEIDITDGRSTFHLHHLLP